MAVPKRYDDFSEIYDRATAALYNRGNAETHGFLVAKQGTYLEAQHRGPNLRPEIDPFGLPMEPRFRRENTPDQDLNNNFEPDDLEPNSPSPQNWPKPRPRGF